MAKLVTMEEVLAIEPHSNADRLEFARVLGYRCLVQKGEFAAGERVVLVQPDTVLPLAAWAEPFRKYAPKRVKAQKFRGEWSMGLVIKPAAVGLVGLSELEPGTDVAEHLGVIKYEAPVPVEGGTVGGLPFGMPKTDEDRYQVVENLPELFGQVVDVSLKIDGQSLTAYHNPDAERVFGVCGRTMEFDVAVKNRWTDQIQRYDLRRKLAAIHAEYGKPFALRGESYGTGIQGLACNPYSRKAPALAFFATYLIDEMRYADPDEPMYYAALCQKFDLPAVPMVERQVPLTAELVRRYDEKLDVLSGEPFEGVVVKGMGFSFKIINKAYDAVK